MTINRPPRDGRMAFVRSPDGISVELLQSGDALGVAASRGRRCRTPASGSAYSARSPTQKCGFQATSQRKPSGSAKYPE